MVGDRERILRDTKMNSYLIKPIDINILHKEIENYLENLIFLIRYHFQKKTKKNEIISNTREISNYRTDYRRNRIIRQKKIKNKLKTFANEKILKLDEFLKKRELEIRKKQEKHEIKARIKTNKNRIKNKNQNEKCTNLKIQQQNKIIIILIIIKT